MPVIRTVTLYSFEELSEEAQQKAINNLSDINVGHDWWEFIYEDAERIGLEITGFDLRNKKSIKGEIINNLLECCKLILKNHGKECDTHNTARHYLKEYGKAFYNWRKANECDLLLWSLNDFNYSQYNMKPIDWLSEFSGEPEEEEVTNDFKKALLEDYFTMLDKEYNYMTSEKAIKDTIKLNEFLFYEDGTLA